MTKPGSGVLIRIIIRNSNCHSKNKGFMKLTGLIRRKNRAEERRESITQAAIQVLQEKGYEQTTMQDIAEAANLSPSSVYYYFDSKIAILESAFNVLVEDITATSQEILNSADPQQSSIEQFILRMNSFRNYDLIRILSEANRSEELHPLIQKMIQETRRELRRRMQMLQEKQPEKKIDPNLAADMVLCIGFGSLILSNFEQESGLNSAQLDKMLSAFNSLLLSSSERGNN